MPLYTYGTDPDQLRAYVLQHEWIAGPAVYSDIISSCSASSWNGWSGNIRQMDAGPGFAWSADPVNRRRQPRMPLAQSRPRWRVHDENCSALQGSGMPACSALRTASSIRPGLLDGSGASSVPPSP